MSSRREVLIRILAPLQRKTFISIEKSHIEMLKMALFHCAVNEKRLQCWRRAGHLPPFFCPHPGGFDSSRAPTPGNLPSKVKNARGQPGGWGEGGLAQVELTDALWRKESEKEKRVVFFFTTFQSNGLHPERFGAFLSCWEYRND